MDDLQISDAIPLSDGSYSTDLVDSTGNVVATVTRLPDGTAQADVSSSSSGFDITGALKKASSFLDSVVNISKTAQSDVTRVQNAIKGAQVGFSAPTTATPYLIGAGLLIAVIAIAHNSGRRSRS